jgi:cytochrome c oxidase subunit 2
MFWFTPTEVGKYEIGCAQLCGIGHTQMVGNVFVDTAADYEAWAKEQLQARTASLGEKADPVETSDARAIAAAPRS